MALALAVVAACYLIGSVPFPVLVSRLVRGIDLRQHGSGNMGATNAARVLGKQWFPVVFGLDFGKGAAAAWLGAALLPGALGIDLSLGAAVGGLLGVVGHCFPILAGFRGGVGLAATAGALAVLSPALMLGGGLSILLFWGLTRNMYVGVAFAALLYPLVGYLVGLRAPAVVAALLAWGLMVFWLHLPELREWRGRTRTEG